MNLYLWASRWGIPQHAIDELRASMVAEHHQIEGQVSPTSEAGVQKRELMASPHLGRVLWRNNVGACVDDRGNHIRYGLANVSKAMNQRIKSSDLIGITPVLITQEMVGYRLGVFTAREIKRPGWVYTGQPREVAQQRFGDIVIAHGGDFQFVN